MATLKDIQRRIRTVEKTQQITSAMRMVAAAKLRRAQDAILAARPYAKKMYATLGEIGRRQQDAGHPLLEAHEQTRTLEIVLVTSDRGLCGAFNNNVIQAGDRAIAEHGPAFDRVLVDAPCTGLGTNHRRPEILLRVGPDDPARGAGSPGHARGQHLRA